MTMTETATGTGLTTMFVVARPVNAGGRREVGEVVFTDSWIPSRADQMVKVGQLQPAPYDLLDTIVTCPCGRAWKNESARHTCPPKES